MIATTERDCPTCWYLGPWTKTCICLSCPKKYKKVTDGDGVSCPYWKPQDWEPDDED